LENPNKPEQALKTGTVFQLISDFRRPTPDVVPNMRREALTMNSISMELYRVLAPCEWFDMTQPTRRQGCSKWIWIFALPGSHADARTTGLVFENFVGHFASTPDEVRNGTIILGDQEETRRLIV
jgi:hypothetical protein